MSRWSRRALSAALAACLILCHTVYAFADIPEETASQVSTGYSESDVEESENFRQPTEPDPELEPETENAGAPQEPTEPPPGEPDTPQTAMPTDLPEQQEDETPKPSGEEDLADTVYDEAELAAWIEQHKETGGTVSLGACVTITESMGIYGIRGEITIDTGEYGFVFDGSTLPSSAIFITGEGVDMPVVEVLRAGDGSFWGHSWNNDLMLLNITATGRDCQGGIAMRILAEDSKAFSMDDIYEQGVIRSYGDGAIGLWLDVSMEAYCYRVEVFGDNSVAAYAPNGADLYYCKLAAEGNGASAAAGDNVTLDTCAATSEPDGVRNFPRSLLPESLRGLYLPIRQNDTLGMFDIYPFTSIILSMSGGDGYEMARRLFPIEWDYDAYDNIDTSVLGKSYISGYLLLPLEGLGLDSTDISLTVEVRDPGLPCIESVSAKSDELEKYFYLSFWDSYDPTDGKIVLWRSDDEGETWWDATWSENVVWDGYGLRFFYDTLEQPVWLVLELVGIGDSNTVVLSEKDGWAVGGSGGDRTGTDREGAGPVGAGKPSGGNDGKPGESEGSGGNGDTSTSGDDGKPSGGDDGTPGESEAPGGNGDTSTGGGKPNSGAAGKGDDGVNDRYAQNKTDAITLNPAPEETPPLDKVGDSVPSFAAGSGTAAGAQENPEADATESKTEDTEKIQPSPTGTPLPITEESLVFDPEQSAPEPGFSVSTLAAFFVGMAVLCLGALSFRSGWFGRWRHEKW